MVPFIHITDPQFSKERFTARVTPLDLWTDKQTDGQTGRTPTILTNLANTQRNYTCTYAWNEGKDTLKANGRKSRNSWEHFQNNNFPILQLYGKHVQNKIAIILVIQTWKNWLLFHPCILLIY